MTVPELKKDKWSDLRAELKYLTDAQDALDVKASALIQRIKRWSETRYAAN